MTVLTADELETKGVSSIEQRLQNDREVVISVRGKPRFVVTEITRYEELLGRGLEATWFQTLEDIAAGRFRQEAVEDHLSRLQAELCDGLQTNARRRLCRAFGLRKETSQNVMHCIYRQSGPSSIQLTI